MRKNEPRPIRVIENVIVYDLDVAAGQVEMVSGLARAKAHL
jgi:hypothetical protein